MVISTEMVSTNRISGERVALAHSACIKMTDANQIDAELNNVELGKAFTSSRRFLSAVARQLQTGAWTMTASAI
ncbi:hypothetical protein [Paraburkholderia sp. SIMBA_027]|uniref:hypothetical protein n=1 Tax=Paraburkholderia sp. SIMBA_027 TaxID=3085770 RepID=UPI00397CED1C